MPKILIVDDSETLRHQLRRDLEQSGYVVVEAVDGEEGLEKFKTQADLALILCDVNMPGMDGLTMCEKLKSLGGPIPPICMLTTESSKTLMARGRELGILAWIIKPYVAKALINAVDTITKRKP